MLLSLLALLIVVFSLMYFSISIVKFLSKFSKYSIVVILELLYKKRLIG